MDINPINYTGDAQAVAQGVLDEIDKSIIRDALAEVFGVGVGDGIVETILVASEALIETEQHIDQAAPSMSADGRDIDRAITLIEGGMHGLISSAARVVAERDRLLEATAKHKAVLLELQATLLADHAPIDGVYIARHIVGRALGEIG